MSLKCTLVGALERLCPMTGFSFSFSKVASVATRNIGGDKVRIADAFLRKSTPGTGAIVLIGYPGKLPCARVLDPDHVRTVVGCGLQIHQGLCSDSSKTTCSQGIYYLVGLGRFAPNDR